MIITKGGLPPSLFSRHDIKEAKEERDANRRFEKDSANRTLDAREASKELATVLHCVQAINEKCGAGVACRCFMQERSGVSGVHRDKGVPLGDKGVPSPMAV